MVWLNGNHGNTKVEIISQGDKYTLNNKDFIILPDGHLVNLRCPYRTTEFCNE